MAPRGALAASLLAACSAACMASSLRAAEGRGSAFEVRRVGLGTRAAAEPDEDVDADADLSLEPFEGGDAEGEADGHTYWFEKEASGQRLKHTEVPREGHVAVVLRGSSFRSNKAKMNCAAGTATLRRQKRATESLVENIIKPFEKAGNKVDIFVTDRVCNFTGEVIVPILGKERVRLNVQNDTGDQRLNVMWAVDELVKTAGGLEKAETLYSHILLLRHDTVWLQHVSDWPEADFSKVLWPYKCPTIGVHDLFTIMPARFLGLYRKTLDYRKCFAGADGHKCLDAMVALTNESSVDVAMRYGGKSGRQPFDFWYTYGRARQTC